MNPTIQAQASQAAAQGQQMLQDDRNKASDAQGQYNSYQGQADAANKNVQNYTQGMQGAYDAKTGNGNAGSAYTFGLNDQLGRTGYDQNSMTAATNNLNQAQGSMSAYNDFANTAASKWGMNAGGFAAANAGALGAINNNIASNQGVVNGLMDKYKTAQTGANQFAGATIQGEHETLAGLNAVFTNASNQRDNAAQQMNFYNKLASDQGGLNAQQQAQYAQAQQGYAQAQAALSQASLFASQSRLAQQQYNLQQQGHDDATSAAAQANSNAMYAAMNHHDSAPAQPTAPANPWTFSRVVNDVNHAGNSAVHGVGQYLGSLVDGSGW